MSDPTTPAELVDARDAAGVRYRDAAQTLIDAFVELSALDHASRNGNAASGHWNADAVGTFAGPLVLPPHATYAPGVGWSPFQTAVSDRTEAILRSMGAI